MRSAVETLHQRFEALKNLVGILVRVDTRVTNAATSRGAQKRIVFSDEPKFQRQCCRKLTLVHESSYANHSFPGVFNRDGVLALTMKYWKGWQGEDIDVVGDKVAKENTAVWIDRQACQRVQQEYRIKR